MYALPSTSKMRLPLARSAMNALPPTGTAARTGESTPPASTRIARSNAADEVPRFEEGPAAAFLKEFEPTLPPSVSARKGQLMPRLPAIDPAHAPDEAKPVLQRFYETRGNYPNMFRTLSIRPEIMRTAAEHMAAVTGPGSVPQALKELCIVLVSTLNSTPYCLASHSALARRHGVDDAVIRSIRDYRTDERLSAAEKAALAVAESITKDPTHLPQPLWEELRRHFDDGQIVEIVCSIGLFNYFNRVNNLLEMEITR
jgi:uncharacterized peroxidase-related enzyme